MVNKALRWYQMKDEEGNIRLHMDRILIRSLLVILICFILIPTVLFITSYYGSPTIMVANEIGDAFGVANAFFSALAFAFLIYTALLQKEELKLQREEIKQNRKELEKSADAQMKMAEITEILNNGSLFPLLHISIRSRSPASNRLEIMAMNRSNQWLVLRDIKDTKGDSIWSNRLELAPNTNTPVVLSLGRIGKENEYVVYYDNFQHMFSRELGVGEEMTTKGKVNKLDNDNIW